MEEERNVGNINLSAHPKRTNKQLDKLLPKDKIKGTGRSAVQGPTIFGFLQQTQSRDKDMGTGQTDRHKRARATLMIRAQPQEHSHMFFASTHLETAFTGTINNDLRMRANANAIFIYSCANANETKVSVNVPELSFSCSVLLS